MSELLPCPHCGHTDIGETWCDRRGELYLAGVHCNQCFASCDSKEAWNTRAPTPTASELVEALEPFTDCVVMNDGSRLIIGFETDDLAIKAAHGLAAALANIGKD